MKSTTRQGKSPQNKLMADFVELFGAHAFHAFTQLASFVTLIKPDIILYSGLWENSNLLLI